MKKTEVQWITTGQAREELGLTPYKMTRLMSETGVTRHKLKARDMRIWYIKVEDVERLREELRQTYESPVSHPKRLAQGKQKPAHSLRRVRQSQ
jgi:hypothetical protein